MIPHEFMTLHTAKAIEYLIAVSYLLLFIPFWRFVNAPVEAVPAHAPRRVPQPGQWFAVPDGLFYHPGHAWLRVDGTDAVTIGIDDFARKLVGAPSAIALPAVGDTVTQGEPAWALVADGRAIEMLSPADGTVLAVNERARHSPALPHEQPYADGWLLKIRAPRLTANLKQLIGGRLAKRWIDDLADSLRGGLTPALAQVYEDGGVVVDGFARSLDPGAWDEVARRFLLTGETNLAFPHATSPEENGGNHA